MRIILAVRLSRDRPETTSVETQLAGLRDYATRGNHVIVAECIDVDESGEKPIRERPKVGAWLAPERLHEWDAVVGYSTDRMFRDLYDQVTFWHDFLEPHGKLYDFSSEPVDLSKPEGRMMVSLRVVMAQHELDKIKERNARATRRLRSQGYWRGGPVPFGYMPKKESDAEGSHWILVPHPEHAQIVREIAEGIIAGMPVRAAARELTTRRIPTGRTRKDAATGEKIPLTTWHANSLARMLRNPTLTGHIVWEYKLAKSGQRETFQLVRDNDGKPLRREAILDDKTFARLQTALKRPEQRAGRQVGVSLLAGIAHCGRRKEGGGLCDAPLWANTFTSRGTPYAYYVCSAECGAKAMPQSDLHAEVESDLAQYFGYLNLERVIVPGSNHDDEIAEVEAQIYGLDLDSPDYDTDLAALRAERARLKALPSEPDRVDWEADGRTFGEVWGSLDIAGKRAKLLQGEYRRTWAYRDEAGRVHFIAPKNLADFPARMQAFGRPPAL